MSEQTIINLIGSIGFPIIVTLYFMFSLNKSLESLKNTVDALRELIDKKLK